MTFGMEGIRRSQVFFPEIYAGKTELKNSRN